MAGRKRMPELDRFMSHVEVAQGGCWEWTAYRLPNGYGQFRLPSCHELAHRAAYRLFVGTPEEGADVMHSCDNPGCVNPAHLSLGSRTDNMQDCKKKGRNAHGEKHVRVKLIGSDIIAIRGIEGIPQRAIAAMFGCSQTQIGRIKNGIRWQQPIGDL
jgi:hypothetical protein